MCVSDNICSLNCASPLLASKIYKDMILSNFKYSTCSLSLKFSLSNLPSLLSPLSDVSSSRETKSGLSRCNNVGVVAVSSPSSLLTCYRETFMKSKRSKTATTPTTRQSRNKVRTVNNVVAVSLQEMKCRFSTTREFEDWISCGQLNWIM